ncbi:PTS sugar transporter subunit IIA [Anaerostipes sp.]|uniref:PTS sugar transporter subunit IIA n=1 Tax=Anaerostipes sp. TaxID=1872530 RepID=UPI0025C45BAF|nr:PTS sugar transporter subunit IIA [Anaerostipes sp.]MBS7008826.1 PTS sugar transporter subunit IIA [Anaerostipes sp.]
MVGILIATHGGFAEGLLNAVELIAGKQEKVKTIGLYHGDGIDDLEQKIRTAVQELDDGDGVLAFVDILGGSPSNMVMKCMENTDNFKAIAGVSMGMAVQAVMMRDQSSLDELVSICEEAGNQPVVLLHKQYEEMLNDTEMDEI